MLFLGENAVFKPFLLTDFQRLLLIKILRPDQVSHVTSAFVSCIMGNNYVSPPGFDLQDLYSDSGSRTPIMFILSPGGFFCCCFELMYLVEVKIRLAKERNLYWYSSKC